MDFHDVEFCCCKIGTFSPLHQIHFIHFCAHFDSLSNFFVGKSFVIAFYYVNLCLNPYFYGRN